MRALILGPGEQAAIAEVVAYAMEPSHHYRIGDPVPGNNPKFVAHIPDGFRCVFTLTHDKGKLYRHLSVSVPAPMMPSPEACVVLAKEFGFTASDNGLNLVARIEKDKWLAGLGRQDEHCVVILQPISA